MTMCVSALRCRATCARPPCGTCINSRWSPVRASPTPASPIPPRFIPGLTASVDYYYVKIGNAISTVSGNANSTYQLCLESANLSSPYCNLIQRPLGYLNTTPANFPTQITSLNQNVAMNSRGGFDTEVDYVSDLSSWADMNGFVNIRLLWNRQE